VTKLHRYPTPEEMSKLRAAARRARARRMGLLFRLGVRTLKSFAARFAAIPSAKRTSHA
jgi:hypothetical protein